MNRTSSKRLVRVETRASPATGPLAIEIEFISAVDGSVTKRMTMKCASHVVAPAAERGRESDLQKPGLARTQTAGFGRQDPSAATILRERGRRLLAASGLGADARPTNWSLRGDGRPLTIAEVIRERSRIQR